MNIRLRNGKWEIIHSDIPLKQKFDNHADAQAWADEHIDDQVNDTPNTLSAPLEYDVTVTMSVETVTVKKIKLDQKALEDIVRSYLGLTAPTVMVSIYQDTIPAGSVMGAIDDITQIAAEVTVRSVVKT